MCSSDLVRLDGSRHAMRAEDSDRAVRHFIEFLDETMRDGQQSLWGMRMQAGMALPVAPLIDRTGFRVIDLAGSSLFEVMIRTCREKSCWLK